MKLILGEAGGAQTPVLAIFGGGMAVGARVASRFSLKWENLLLAYALVEGLSGLVALVFDPAFEVLTQLAYTRILPVLDSSLTVNAFKWGLSALLILPQSVMLGITFPLMSSGILRAYPDALSVTIAMLYFTSGVGRQSECWLAVSC